MEEELKRLKEEAESAGLYINIIKMKGMRVNTSNTQKFSLGNTELKKSDPLYNWDVWCQRMEEQRKMWQVELTFRRRYLNPPCSATVPRFLERSFNF